MSAYYINKLIHHMTNPDETNAPTIEQSIVRMIQFAGIEKVKGNFHTWTAANEMIKLAQEVLDEKEVLDENP